MTQITRLRKSRSRKPFAALSAAMLALAPACAVTERGVESPRPHVDRTVRVEGTVSRSDRLPTPEERLREVAVITLHASGEPIRVELAPGWFLEEHGLRYTPEERLLVTGERIEADGEPRLVAREVEQGRVRLRLRDERGQPLWPQAPRAPSSEEPAEGAAAEGAASPSE